MFGLKKLASILATLALVFPLVLAQPNRWDRDRKEQKQDRKEERKEERRERQNQQNSNQQSNNPSKPQPPTVPGSTIPAMPLNGPGPHAGDWLRRMVGLPPQEQQKQLESDPNFRRLTPDQQQRLRQRLNWFSSQPPDQQQRILNGMEFREHLTEDQKLQERQLFQRYHSLPVYRQRAVRNALLELNSLPPDQRQQALSSPDFRARYTDQEREIIAHALQFGTPPSQMQPNSNH
jgi:hypothetical protein